nr:hypothetical protein [Tanacetum cinerariifolium]
MRDEFWDTAPHYGGRKEIWDALQAAAEADLTLAQLARLTFSICWLWGRPMEVSKGAKYELPKYVLSAPTNLIRDS